MTEAEARLRCLELAVETLSGEESDFIHAQVVAQNFHMFTQTGQIHAVPAGSPDGEPEERVH